MVLWLSPDCQPLAIHRELVYPCTVLSEKAIPQWPFIPQFISRLLASPPNGPFTACGSSSWSRRDSRAFILPRMQRFITLVNGGLVEQSCHGDARSVQMRAALLWDLRQLMGLTEVSHSTISLSWWLTWGEIRDKNDLTQSSASLLLIQCMCACVRVWRSGPYLFVQDPMTNDINVWNHIRKNFHQQVCL